MPIALKNKKPEKKAAAKKPVVINLGHVGYSPKNTSQATHAIKIATRFPGIRLVGVDLKSAKRPVPKNMVQTQADFVKGLEQRRNHSVDRIVSNMAVGHYILSGSPFLSNSCKTRKNYTIKILDLAFKKLKKDGKMVITVGDTVLADMLQWIPESPFSINKMKLVKMSKKRGSHWVKTYDRPVYRIILKK